MLLSKSKKHQIHSETLGSLREVIAVEKLIYNDRIVEYQVGRDIRVHLIRPFLVKA